MKHIPVLDPRLIAGEPLITYPNPFSKELKLLFSLKEPAAATLSVYSVNGQKVVSLHAPFVEPGTTEIIWNGRDAAGNRMKEGMYIVELIVNNKVRGCSKGTS